jgi:hypothetical protein
VPHDKDLKRLVRARMEKTGESYTSARANLLHRYGLDESGDAAPPPIPDNCAELAGMGDDKIAAKTGRTWVEWVRALDAIGAADMEHKQIAAWVHEQTGLSWWSQTVTVGYERIRGLRDVGQRRGGGYEAGKSRTLNVPVADVFRAFVDDDLRTQWLDTPLTVRTATPNRSVRITWLDGSNVEVYITAKSAAKTSVAIQHGRLPSRDAADDAKAFWHDRLNALQALLS